MIRRFSLSLLPFLFLVALSSCVSHQKLTYINDPSFLKNIDTVIVHSPPKKVATIQVHDELYIQVFSIDQDQYNFFYNQSQSNRLTPRTSTDFSIVAYPVGVDGSINFPLLGNVKVQGQTINEAEQSFQNLLKPYLNQPTVKINFVNKSITVVGEVARPGKYYYSEENMNIMDAISLAGDVLHFGNRKKVKILREEGDKVMAYSIYLTDK
jgi:polysaccharide export outer membrane protein